MVLGRLRTPPLQAAIPHRIKKCRAHFAQRAACNAECLIAPKGPGGFGASEDPPPLQAIPHFAPCVARNARCLYGI